MASRNETKASVAIEELRRETGNLAIFLRLDLADLRSVKAAATEFMRRVSSLFVSVVGLILII